MLAVQEIDVFIQASHILRRVSLEVREREVVCLVGRNGAGKTTTLRTIMGYHRPRGGGIRFNEVALHERRTFEIARLGLGFAPEDVARLDEHVYFLHREHRDPTPSPCPLPSGGVSFPLPSGERVG